VKKVKAGKLTAKPAKLKRFRAGCGREQDGPADLGDLAYTDLAFVECPACEHRLTPEDGPFFCRWLDMGAPKPFSALASWSEG
jgi:hypothetical protein